MGNGFSRHTVHGARHSVGFRCIHEQSGCKRRAKSWEAHECNQQFGENESIRIGKSQILRNVGNARINTVSAMRPGFEKIIEKVPVPGYFESPETVSHIAENACGNDYADTWSSKRVYRLSKQQSPHCGTSDHEWEDLFELYTVVAGARLPITGIHTQVASKSKIHCLPATFHNSR